MQIPRPTDEVKEFFRSVVPEAPGVVIKPTFGNLGAFVNGNMFAGLFGSSIGVRLPDAAAMAELQAVEGTGPYGPPERPMGGYIALPEAWASSPERVTEWMQIALSQVGRLPPKQPKPRKKE
ncbi:TfoX/Sxy family transcriptional regulator of competence genes [Microterricola gilva]|uniref:TfoX/Sxy family transcriptional regulator of competence genes n=1 Tax=Microterricola gilva TaxID=393267 RepID=A0A4V2GAT9_9MICO|nr:TfoX/Sxy family protein [Microterricola gilva]RZU65606.1 TfoX/Sxy family transcriptional regulator of competence genes [Microterricola gilva]